MKNRHRKQLYMKIRKWFLLLEGVGKDNSLYQNLHIAYVYQKNDVEFVRQVVVLINNIRTKQDELNAFGINTDMADELEANRAEFWIQLAAYDKLVQARKVHKAKQAALVKRLRADIRRYNSIGKSIWLDVDEGKYLAYSLK